MAGNAQLLSCGERAISHPERSSFMFSGSGGSEHMDKNRTDLIGALPEPTQQRRNTRNLPKRLQHSQTP